MPFNDSIAGLNPCNDASLDFAPSGRTAALRSGGVLVSLAAAVAHTAAHLTVALTLVLLLEVAVQMCVVYEGLGQQVSCRKGRFACA